MMNRRQFLALSAGTGLSLAAPHARADLNPSLKGIGSGVQHLKDLPAGRLIAPLYGTNRFRFTEASINASAHLLELDIQSLQSRYIPSNIGNFHSITQAHADNPDGLIFGVGQAGGLGVYRPDFSLVDTKTFTGIAFRGHGIPYRDGVMITAQRTTTTDPEERNGVLLYVNAKGDLLGQVDTGGLHPHEVVDCGAYLAVTHYGIRPASLMRHREKVIDPNAKPGHHPMMDAIDPGVAFLDKETLSLRRFVHLPAGAIAGHLTALVDGSVLVNSANSLSFPDAHALHAAAQRDGAQLSADELRKRYYNGVNGFTRVSALSEEVESIPCPAGTMRGGQSVTRDTQLNIVASSWSDSNTIRVNVPGRPVAFLNTLDYGLATPRGCVFIPGTGCLAISSQGNNIIIVNVLTGALIKRFGLALTAHSHLHWLPALT